MSLASRRIRWLVIVLAGLTLSSCAYYNTYYLAKKYYEKGTAGAPYPVEKAPPEQIPNFNHAVEYSKKLLAQYPKSKWVDDAYLIWACSLLGSDDPRQASKMLEDYTERFPKSPLKAEASFYLGVAYRQSRKYESALRALDEFLAQAPRHRLIPYAHLERARVLTALDRPEEAAAAATQVLEHYPRSTLNNVARIARAEARFAQGDFAGAREDFHQLGRRSRDDEQRFTYLLREADCLEGARQYDQELVLLRAAISHEQTPAQQDTAGQSGIASLPAPTGGLDHHGRLMIRIGTAHLLAGRLQEALQSYQRVIRDYPRTPLAVEAQYRIGYAYETGSDDFDRARVEYTRARDVGGATDFGAQAAQRLTNLERLATYRAAGIDSLEKKAEAGFLLAELYLFQLNKPDRALEEYGKVVEQFPGTPQAAKAINAKAWVLSRKLRRKAEADSLFWTVIKQYPATEAQLAARDYLELEGVSVPSELIKLPAPKLAVADTMPHLTQPPESVPGLGAAGGLDSLSRLGPRRSSTPTMMLSTAPPGSPNLAGDTPSRTTPADMRPGVAPASSARDSTGGPRPSAPDTSRTRTPFPKPPPSPAPVDTTGTPR